MMKWICAKFVHLHKKRERRRRKQRWRYCNNEGLIYTSQEPENFGSDRYALKSFVAYYILVFIVSTTLLIEEITRYAHQVIMQCDINCLPCIL